MPSWSLNKKLTRGAKTDGEARKIQSSMVMEATWDEDIYSHTCYFYDWYSDKNSTVLDNLSSQTDNMKIPMDVKIITSSSQTYSKDPITYHLQLKPSQKNVVPYYNDRFKEQYGAHYPCGLYCDIPDEKGKYNRWLVVGEANYNDPEFPTFEVLRCDYVFRWIYKDKKYEVPGVLRSQNSYNSGVWRDDKTVRPEDQQKFIVPLNRDTESIFYDLRMIIDADVLTEPRAWSITKIDRISAKGIAMFTLAQDKFDQHNDFIEIDEKTNRVVAMWCDYNNCSHTPINAKTIIPLPRLHGVITYAGVKPEVKVGGRFKKFTVTFYDGDEKIGFKEGEWSFFIGDDPMSELIETRETDNPSTIEVKFLGDESYLSKLLTIKYSSDDSIDAMLDVDIVSL